MSNTTNVNGCRFYPVQCTDEIFQTLTAQEGYLYFVTDKKKIYLGKNKTMIPMCANSGIFYGIKPIEYDNSGIKPNPEVTFLIDDIEGDDKPEVDDLILNIGTDEFPDGCFYRVENIVEDAFETVRLTLQGSGGSGGPVTPGGNFGIQIIGNKSKVYPSTTNSMNITFKGNYSGIDENYISKVSFKKRGENEPFYSIEKVMSFNENQTIDLIDFIDQFNQTKTTVEIFVEDAYGNERSTNFSIQIIELSLKMSSPELIYTSTKSCTYAYYLQGGKSGVSNKKITYTFYNENNLNKAVLTLTDELNIEDEGQLQTTLNLATLVHGIYVVKVIASAYISSSGTTIYSNELVHKIGNFINATEPLLMIGIPEITEQYTNIPLNYLLVDSESNKKYTLDIKLNGIQKTSLNIETNILGNYPLYFENKGTYTLTCTVIEMALSHISYLNIVPYTGKLPIIDPTRSDLMLYLSPKGKINDSVDRNIWKDYNNKYSATLNNLHYGKTNGWLMDENGTSYLKLSSGASMLLDDFLPFKYDPTKTTSADDRMGYGMTIELDFKLSGVLDYDEELIKCISTNKDGDIQVGFSITGNKIRFYNSRLNDSLNEKGEKVGSLMSLNIVEGKRIRASFVIEPNTGSIEYPMCYTYLDGKLSAAVIYNSGDSYKDSTDNPARLQISADNAQIEIYSIRFYSNALTDRVILNNFTASLPTLQERQERYDTNNILSASGEVSLDLITAEEYDLQIPYMKITGGWATEKDDKWRLKNQTSANVGLPTGKKDYRLIDVEVVYPKNQYFANYKDYKFTNIFKDGKLMSEAYGEKPENGGAIMYAQGTSSMEYPVKNLRLRFKEEQDWYTVRPDIDKVEIICMKADYMESSGSHNTGSANFIDALYQEVGIKTPGQEHFGGEDKNKIVTCIKGYPCLIFYSETGVKGSYKYIGKYNLNLDKATPEPFGFNHDDDNDDFGYLETGDKYYDIKYDDEGKYIKDQVETEKEVQEGEKINSIHCFEFLDNAVEICNFKKKAGETTYENSWYGTFKNSDNEMVPGWTLGFESRYPEDKVGYHDADSLYPLAKWLNDLYEKRIAEEESGKSPQKITYVYEYTKATEYQEFIAYYIQEGESYKEAYPSSQEDIDKDIYYTRTIKSSRFEMESLERFKREYQCYLDKDFLLTYYLVTEALLMADSRVKNMMIATWGKEKRSYLNMNEEKVETNNYIFYPIFYDMDTMLGLDNTGVYRFEYFDEDTDSSIFNGDEVLWNFVRDALVDELAPWYNTLENASLTANNILPYFNKNQANMANEAFYNGDAIYKYTDPARNGYRDDLHNKDIKPGEGPFLYAAQGDRSLMREWFLTNRIKFLHGKYNSSNYQSGDRIEFRWYYPTGQDKDEQLNKSCQAVPPDGKFNFTSLQTGYAGVKLGANGNVYNKRFDGEETKEIELPEASSANGTEAYLLGLSNLTDLGDLSNKYMQKFYIASGSDVRLKSLTLGNAHKDYYNPYWKPGEGQSQTIGLSSCSYLETFNLQNCSSYNSILDFSDCPNIKRILLTGSGVSGITLPINGIIEELRLPTTIKNITINSHNSLKAENFSIGSYNYNGGEKIGQKDENGKLIGNYVNNFSEISKLYVVDTPIDTYEMVRQAKNLTEYYLKGINWIITEDDTQYCVRLKNEYDPNKTYYYYQNGEYILYEDTEYPSDMSLYEKFTMLNENNKVVCIPVLEYLQTKAFMEGTKHGEALSGIITISIAGATANELEIYEKYVKTFPNVKIQYSNMDVENAYTINFYRIDVDTLGDNGTLQGIEPYFSTLTGGNYLLSELINTPSFELPQKTASTTQTFEFSGVWLDWNDNKKVYYQDNAGFDPPQEDYIAFSEIKPTSNMNLVPKFKTSTRIYTVNFYDYNYTVESEPLFTVDCEYEDNLGEKATDLRVKYIYRPYISQEPNQDKHNRYTLKGWQTESDFNNQIENPTMVNLNDVFVTENNLKYFAYYEIEDATLIPTNIEFFNIIETNNEIIINLKSEYTNILGGKITLPSVYDLDKYITTVGAFNNASLITDIYFLSTAKYSSVANGSCKNMQNLKNVYLPETIVKIGKQSFADNLNLQNIVLSDNITIIDQEAFYIFGNNGKLQLEKLPSNIITLGDRAFCNGGPNVKIKELPNSLKTIGAQCFGSCSNISINQFGGQESNLTSIGFEAFRGANIGTDAPLVTEITIGEKVELKLGGYPDPIYYRTFVNGYSNVNKLYIYCNHQYSNENDLINDLFGDGHIGVEVHSVIS